MASLFSGVNFYIVESSLSEERRNLVVQLLTTKGAKRSNYLTDRITLVIADNCETSEVGEAKEIYDKPVVTSLWVELSVQCNASLPFTWFSPESPQIFRNVNVCPTNVSSNDSARIWLLVLLNGGSCSANITSNTTHLVCGEPQGAKYDAVVQGDIDVKLVSPDWVVDSISAKRLMNESNYHPARFIDPRFMPQLFGDTYEDNNYEDKERVAQEAAIQSLVASLKMETQQISQTPPPSASVAQRYPEAQQTTQTTDPAQIFFPSSFAQTTIQTPQQISTVTTNSGCAGPSSPLLPLDPSRFRELVQQQQPPAHAVSNSSIPDVQAAHSVSSGSSQPSPSSRSLAGTPSAGAGSGTPGPIQSPSPMPRFFNEAQQMASNIPTSGGYAHMASPGHPPTHSQLVRSNSGGNIYIQNIPRGPAGPVRMQYPVQQYPVQHQIPANVDFQQQQQQSIHYQQQAFSPQCSQGHPGYVQVPHYANAVHHSPGYHQQHQQLSPGVPYARSGGGYAPVPSNVQSPQGNNPQQFNVSQQMGYVQQPQAMAPQSPSPFMNNASRMISPPPRAQMHSVQSQMAGMQPIRLPMQDVQGMGPPMHSFPQSQRPPVAMQQQQRVCVQQQQSPNYAQMQQQRPIAYGVQSPQQHLTVSTGPPSFNQTGAMPRQPPCGYAGPRMLSPPHPQVQQQPVHVEQRIQYFGHDPRQSVPPELCLLGCVFLIVDYERIVDQSQVADWRICIIQHGGEVETSYSNRVTHVVCDGIQHPVVRQAIKECKRCVTAQWLNDCLLQKRLIPPFKAIHLPSQYGDNKPCKDKLFTITGFEGNERNCVKQMVAAVGARLTNYLCRSNSVLIAKRLDGKKVEKAQEWNIPVLNEAWLAELVIGNAAVVHSVRNGSYSPQTGRGSNLSELTLSPFVMHLLSGWRIPITLFDGDAFKAATERKHKLENDDGKLFLYKKLRLSPAPGDADCPVLNHSENLPNDGKPIVLFTGLYKPEVENLTKKIRWLNGEVTDDIVKCSCVIASDLKRTMKLLKAICIGRPILSPNWVRQSFKMEQFLGYSDFILSDEGSEKFFGFNIKLSLYTARRKTLFEKLLFYLTPSISPSLSIIKELIETAGGTVLDKRPPSAKILEFKQRGINIVVISCDNDLHLCANLFQKKIEFVLTGILRQEVDYESYRIEHNAKT